MRVLLFEDNRDTVQLIVDIIRSIENDRWDVTPAYNFSDGLRLYREIFPDIIILDPGLPDANLVTVLNTIPELKKSALVILTGNDNESVRRRCLEAGADVFLSKDCLSDGKSFIQSVREAWTKYTPRTSVEVAERGHIEIGQAEITLIRKIPDLTEKVDEMYQATITGTQETPSFRTQLAIGQEIMHNLTERAGKLDDKLDRSRVEGLIYFVLLAAFVALLNFVQDETAVIKGQKAPPQIKMQSAPKEE